jgi:hypothetical protein
VASARRANADAMGRAELLITVMKRPPGPRPKEPRWLGDDGEPLAQRVESTLGFGAIPGCPDTGINNQRRARPSVKGFEPVAL